MTVSSPEVSILSRGIVEMLLDDFFNSPKNQERFLNEFSNSFVCRRFLKGTTLRKSIESNSWARKKLVHCCLEYPEFLKEISLLRVSNGYALPDKITKKDVEKAYESSCLLEVVWKVLAGGEAKITKGAFNELKHLLGGYPNSFGTSAENLPGSSASRGDRNLKNISSKSDSIDELLVSGGKSLRKSGFLKTAQNEKLIRENKLLRERLKKLKKENQVLKKEKERAKKESKAQKLVLKKQEKKCKNCAKREFLNKVENVKGIWSKVSQMLEQEEYGNLKKLLNSKNKLMKTIEESIEKIGEEVRKAEKQICCRGQPKLILVDGHNLIFRGQESEKANYLIESIGERGLRNKLILDLYFAAERLNCTIKAFFDSKSGNSYDNFGNLKIYYCFNAEGGADRELIMEMQKVRNGENVLVFSSDRKHIWKHVRKLKKTGKIIDCNSVETLANYLLKLRKLLEIESLLEQLV